MEQKNLIRTKSLIEQHFHGAYGVNFNTAKADEIIGLGKKLLAHGVTLFFPTLHTDSTENLKKQIAEIKEAKIAMPPNYAQIGGIHLEGPFINPEKKGIHPERYIKTPDIEGFMEIYDETIKIVTLAPELDENHDLSRFLELKNIKVSAGHTKTKDLSAVSQVTHIFNAMDGVNHKEKTTATLALVDDNVAAEVIADSVHIENELLKLIFKCKPNEKVLLISDCLPIAFSNLDEIVFCDEKIYFHDFQARNQNGVLAGSTMLLDGIIKNAARKGLLDFDSAVKFASDNIAKNLSLEHKDHIYWDKFMNIKSVEINGQTVFQA